MQCNAMLCYIILYYIILYYIILYYIILYYIILYYIILYTCNRGNVVRLLLYVTRVDVTKLNPDPRNKTCYNWLQRVSHWRSLCPCGAERLAVVQSVTDLSFFCKWQRVFCVAKNGRFGDAQSVAALYHSLACERIL